MAQTHLFLWKRKRLEMKLQANETDEGLKPKREREAEKALQVKEEESEPSRTSLTPKE